MADEPIDDTLAEGEHPEPADIIWRALTEHDVPEGFKETLALAVFTALRDAEALRTEPMDWPPVPDGGMLITDVRLVEFLAPGSHQPAFRLAVIDGTSFSAVYGLLGMCGADLDERFQASLGRRS